MRKRKSVEERLLGKIDKRGDNECWPWLGGTVPKGYGTVKVPNGATWKSSYAHREMLKIFKGIPTTPNAQALHSCDNPNCCNPNHLNWGTESNNRKEARDRLHNQGNQKLTPDQVITIRADSRIYKEIANEYSVHLDTISRIKTNRSWLP